eukprot:gb/GECG01010109.1/.p1 GENE.gb/GECG01010109.1/~~gb/GECG01010109.1/.p1  ORF type:complete len:691 (+),score=85.30 gb/GECG01010109.1/:1-2073(+)
MSAGATGANSVPNTASSTTEEKEAQNVSIQIEDEQGVNQDDEAGGGSQNGGQKENNDDGESASSAAEDDGAMVYEVVGKVPALTLEWNDIVLKVPVGEEKKQPCKPAPETKYKTILNSISGKARPGELVAILGASGAGKTSLLNLISRRSPQTSGEVLINGKPATKSFPRIAAYVQQEDLFLPSLTVKEHLRFQVALRLGDSVDDEEKENRVQSLISALGLRKVENSIIGSAKSKRGISGGEKKRLALASEIITNPSLLFADEPTSGLDSYMAESIIKMLKNLAHAGRTVVTTIHQPSSEVFHLFDKLVLMREGEIVFFGDKDDATQYFAQIDPYLECPTYTNPADFFIKALSVNSPKHSKYELIEGLGRRWKESDLNKKLLTHDDTFAKSAMKLLEDEESIVESKYAVNRWKQFKLLTSRALLDTSRNPILTYARAMQTIILALIAGAIFYQLGFDQSSIQGRNGAIFFIIINQSFSGIFGVLQTFPLERPIFLREHANGTYSVSSYYFAKLISDLPFQVLFPTIFCSLVFWMMELGTEFWRFAAFTGVVVLTANTAMSLGYFLSAAVPSVDVALALGPVALLPMLLTGGLLINTEAIPDWLVWVEAVSFIQYGYQSAGEIIWDGLSLSCHDVEPGEPCRETGRKVLDQFFPEADLVTDLIPLAALLVGLRILTYLALRLKAAQNKRQL